MPEISELPAASALTASDTVPVVQGGETRKASFVELLGRERTAAEIAAGVTPSSYVHGDLPAIDLRRYGMDASASGATNRAALENAREVARLLGGAILQAPPGTLDVDATVTIDADRIVIRGAGMNVTKWRFDPGAADVLFHFTRGASSIVQAGIESCGFTSTNTVNKTAIQFDDMRDCFTHRIGISSGAWQGSGSIGLHTKGRDTFSCQKFHVLCARPILIDNNPNYSTLACDHFHFQDMEVGSTETTGKCIEFADGVPLTNVTFDGYQAWVLGKYGLYWNDTTSTIAGYNLKLSGVRSEQASDATGYSVYLASTAQNLQEVLFDNCRLDSGRNGIYGRKLQRVTLVSSKLAGGSGRTNLDITFEALTELHLINTMVQASSTVTLTNGVLVSAAPQHATASAAMPFTAFYRYAEAALVSQRPEIGYGGVKRWSYHGTLADDATLNLPVSDASGITVATVKVSAAGDTQYEAGEVLFSLAGIKQITGTPNFALTNTDAKLCVYDGGTDDVTVRNRLGESATVLIEATWA